MKVLFFVFQEKLQSLINEQPTLKPYSEVIFRQPSLYGDYRTALDMGEARIYEDIQDYEAAKSIFDEVKILINAFYFIRLLPLDSCGI